MRGEANEIDYVMVESWCQLHISVNSGGVFRGGSFLDI